MEQCRTLKPHQNPIRGLNAKVRESMRQNWLQLFSRNCGLTRNFAELDIKRFCLGIWRCSHTRHKDHTESNFLVFDKIQTEVAKQFECFWQAFNLTADQFIG